MKHKKKIYILILTLFVIFVCHGYGVDLSLKFSGGLSYLNLELINSSLKAWSQFHRVFAEKNPDIELLGGEISGFHSAFDFEWEVFFSLSSHFAVSVGTGYIYGEMADKKTEHIQEELGTFIYWVQPTKVSAFPVNLTGYYSLPLKKKLSLYLKGGAGFIWSKYIERTGLLRSSESLEKNAARNYNYRWFQRASARDMAFFGGLGTTVEIEPGIRLFAEASARIAKANGFLGENQDGDTGTLYYFEQYFQDIDFWQAKNQILLEKPTGKNFRSVQKTAVNFSGFSVKIGLLIDF